MVADRVSLYGPKRQYTTRHCCSSYEPYGELFHPAAGPGARYSWTLPLQTSTSTQQEKHQHQHQQQHQYQRQPQYHSHTASSSTSVGNTSSTSTSTITPAQVATTAQRFRSRLFAFFQPILFLKGWCSGWWEKSQDDTDQTNPTFRFHRQKAYISPPG